MLNFKSRNLKIRDFANFIKFIISSENSLKFIVLKRKQKKEKVGELPQKVPPTILFFPISKPKKN